MNVAKAKCLYFGIKCVANPLSTTLYLECAYKNMLFDICTKITDEYTILSSRNYVKELLTHSLAFSKLLLEHSHESGTGT